MTFERYIKSCTDHWSCLVILIWLGKWWWLTTGDCTLKEAALSQNNHFRGWFCTLKVPLSQHNHWRWHVHWLMRVGLCLWMLGVPWIAIFSFFNLLFFKLLLRLFVCLLFMFDFRVIQTTLINLLLWIFQRLLVDFLCRFRLRLFLFDFWHLRFLFVDGWQIFVSFD